MDTPHVGASHLHRACAAVAQAPPTLWHRRCGKQGALSLSSARQERRTRIPSSLHFRPEGTKMACTASSNTESYSRNNKLTSDSMGVKEPAPLIRKATRLEECLAQLGRQQKNERANSLNEQAPAGACWVYPIAQVTIIIRPHWSIWGCHPSTVHQVLVAVCARLQR